MYTVQEVKELIASGFSMDQIVELTKAGKQSSTKADSKPSTSTQLSAGVVGTELNFQGMSAKVIDWKGCVAISNPGPKDGRSNGLFLILTDKEGKLNRELTLANLEAVERTLEDHAKVVDMVREYIASK